MISFDVGDFVYIDFKNSIGQISDINMQDDGNLNYQVYYCQGKDPDKGVIGGNGPIFMEGYPKKITNPSDILFVVAMKERAKIKNLKIELILAEDNFKALKIARNILKEQYK